MSRTMRCLRPRLPPPLRPPLLPATIAVMALVLVLKLAGLGQGGHTPSMLGSAGLVMLPSAKAADHDSEKPRSGKSEDHKQADQKPMAGAPPPAPAADPGPGPEERAILLDLRGRRKTLDDREASLASREAVLAAAERRLSGRLDELAALQAKLEQMDQTRRERDEANWRSMVKTYETMRPRDAAAIFNDLDSTVLLQVLDRMKESKAAAVLAAMQTERARLATTELAKWRTRVPPAPDTPGSQK